MAIEALVTQEEKLLANPDSEMIVLGSMLCQPENIDDVIELLKPEDFFRKPHRAIYSTICRMYNRNGEPPDPILLSDYLESKGKLQAVGGGSYISELEARASSDGSWMNMLEHARVVRGYAIRRCLRDTAQEVAGIAFDEEVEDDQRLIKAEEVMHKLTAQQSSADLVSGVDAMSDFVTWLENRSKLTLNEMVGVPSGFTDFDRMTGGFQPGELYILGGRPGQGKTSLLLNMILNAMSKIKGSIAIYSLEMSLRDLLMRLVSMKTAIDSRFMRMPFYLQEEDYQKIIEATDELSNERWFVDESGKLSIPEMRMKCKRHKMKHGLDLIIVDYLQMMDGVETQGKRQYNRTEEVGEISRGLKQLAKELDVPVIAAAALSRASEQRADKRPQLSDLRESGKIESDADMVFFVHRCQEEDKQNMSEIIVPKNRNGPVGEIMLYFDAKYTRFRNLEPDYSNYYSTARQEQEEEETNNDI